MQDFLLKQGKSSHHLSFPNRLRQPSIQACIRITQHAKQAQKINAIIRRAAMTSPWAGSADRMQMLILQHGRMQHHTCRPMFPDHLQLQAGLNYLAFLALPCLPFGSAGCHRQAGSPACTRRCTGRSAWNTPPTCGRAAQLEVLGPLWSCSWPAVRQLSAVLSSHSQSVHCVWQVIGEWYLLFACRSARAVEIVC